MINELADYKPLPDALRDAGVSHAALCSSCAANLADARSVSSFLLRVPISSCALCALWSII